MTLARLIPFFLLLAGCVQPPDAESLPGAQGPFRQVQGAGLSRALEGNSIVRKFRELWETPFAEEFGSGGRYTLYSGGLALNGSYEVRGGRYCMSIPAGGGRRCNQLFAGQGGQLFLSSVKPTISPLNAVTLTRTRGDPLRPVAGAELQSLLSNVGVDRAPSREPGAIEVRVPSGEFFEADGSYTRRVEHAAIRGTYTIRGARPCVEVPGWTTRCRGIFRNPQGLYFTRYEDSPGTLMEITVKH